MVSSSCRLIYRSQSSWEDLSNEMLEELIVKSSKSNSDLGISGLLLLSDVTFLQVLEGPDHKVNALFQKIQNDPRHEQVVLLDYTQTTDQFFGDWGMNIMDMFDLPQETRQLLCVKYNEIDGFIQIPKESEQALALLLDAKALLTLKDSN